MTSIESIVYTLILEMLENFDLKDYTRLEELTELYAKNIVIMCERSIKGGK